MKTKRLVIRPLKESDYKKWFKGQCTLTFFKRMLKKYQKYKADKVYYHLGIFEKKTGIFVGELDFDIKRKTASIGYAIFEEHWYQGYGREAVKEAIQYGFKKLKLEEIIAKIDLDNKKSIRMAKAIGMKKKITKKRHVIYVAYAKD